MNRSLGVGILVCAALIGCEPATSIPPGSDGGTGGGGGGGSPVNDLGFRANPNGMSFENYTNDGVTNLTPVEVRRMFGDGACASLAQGSCTLTPAAAQWMQQANAMMSGGHCFGFSHFSLQLFKGALRSDDFGGPNGFALQKSNEKVQREIAFWMAMQLVAPANASIQGTRPTPQQLLKQLTEGWGRQEVFTLAFFNRQGGGGHAVTPWSVRTRGDGKQELVVYDNNFPNAERVVLFDPTNDTWSYSAAINPTEAESQYDGDANTKSIFAVPVKDATLAQQCPFCGDASASSATQSPRTVGVVGSADLLVEDGQGHAIGTSGKTLTNNFPGATAFVPLSADLYKDNTEPQYRLPGGSDLKVTLDGSKLSASEQSMLSVVGPGYALSVEQVKLDPGQKDTVLVSADGETVTYQASGSESAEVYNSFSTSGADYEVGAKVSSDGDGSSFTMSRSGNTVRVRFSGAGATQYGLILSRVDQTGTQSFLHTGEALSGDATLSFDLSAWTGNGATLAVAVDENSDGSIERTEQLSDQD